MQRLILGNDITTARLLIDESLPNAEEEKIFLIQQHFNQVRNPKKAAILIKDFKLDVETIDKEFYQIEDVIINDCM